MTNSTAPLQNRTIPDAWLPAAWVGWLILAVTVLTIHLLGTPIYYEQLMTPLSQPDMPWEQPKPADAAALQALGIPLQTYARFLLAHVLLYSVATYSMGVVVFWRRSHDAVAFLASCTFISFSLGENSADHLLKLAYPIWHWPVEIIQMISIILLFWFGYLFPNGRFVPGWSRWCAFVWAGLMFCWLLFPALPFNPLYGETAERTPFLSSLVFAGYASTALYAQAYRYRWTAGPVERIQTRWIVLGFYALFLVVVVRYFPSALFAELRTPGLPHVLHVLVAFPLSNWFPLAMPVAMTIAILRYRLWVIDPILNRALVYTLLTTLLVTFYIGSVWLLQNTLHTLTTQSSTIAVVITTAATALLFAPVRHSIQRYIDRTFQRERIDVQTAFSTLQQEIRTMIALPDLLERLVARLTDLLHATHGVIYLADDAGNLIPTKGLGLTDDSVPVLAVTPFQRQRLQEGTAVATATAPEQILLVPLTAPQAERASTLVGVLALGRRLNGQPYLREDLRLLETLGVQAGTALVVARLVAEEQTHSAWRNSPAGQAAGLAAALPPTPQALLPELHALATRAHTDLEAANILRHLAEAFHQRDNAVAATLAQGYYFLAAGYREPALLAIGLRTLVTELSHASSATWPAAATLHHPLVALLRDLQAETVPQLIEAAGESLAPAVHLPAGDEAAAATELHLAHQQLRNAAGGLAAYAQAETVDEQLGLLVQTLDRLTTLTHSPAEPLLSAGPHPGATHCRPLGNSGDPPGRRPPPSGATGGDPGHPAALCPGSSDSDTGHSHRPPGDHQPGAWPGNRSCHGDGCRHGSRQPGGATGG
ncbi:MAG: GAF domain-containing protein [Caldilineaceae bacterium]